MTERLKPKPVGSRPRCLNCGKELRPKWDREHKIFKGTYGGYGDNRFCGLSCGYCFAVAHAKPKGGE